MKLHLKIFLVQSLKLLLLSHNIKKDIILLRTTLHVMHSFYSWHCCFTGKWYITRHYTYFYIFSTVVGKLSSFDGAILCHWRGLRLQLDSLPLEGDGATSWCWLSSCSGSSDRKLGNVCARGIKVIDRPVPVERREQRVNGACVERVYLFLVITICPVLMLTSFKRN